MLVYINQESISTECKNLAELVEEQALREPFAIALNNGFIPKPEYCEQALNDQDKIEVLYPVQGG